MKRVIFDHNVPARLVRLLKPFDIKLARDLGWQELRNGKLLQAAEDNGFHILSTGDKTLPIEQNLFGRKIGIVVMSANHWKIIRDYAPAIAEALHKCKPGQVMPVFSGAYSPHQRNKPQGPTLA